MGGSVAVTIRTPDGEWHKMERWTNSAAATFTDPSFLAGDEEFIADYINTWTEMCDAYDNCDLSNKPMAEVYCTSDGARGKTAPIDYGLVFIDFLEKRFWHCQGYSDMQTISLFKIYNAVELQMGQEEDDQWLERVYKNIVGIKEEKKIEDKYQPVVTLKRFATLDELKDYARDQKTMFAKFAMDTQGWNFVSYDENQKGIMSFKQDLLDNGYSLSAEEDKMWDDFIADHIYD